MYLSQLILDPRSRRTQAELTHPYEMHRTLMQAFPDELHEDERVLFRVDIDRRSGVPVVLVQSRGEPDWSFLHDCDNYLRDAGGKDNPAYKAVHLNLREGQVLAFRLRANPTAKRNGKRLGLFDEQDQLTWLQRKGEAGGFGVVSSTVRPEGFEESDKHVGGQEMTISHYAVRFDGHLQVTNPDLFIRTIAAGIGPAKAFGFGLLSVAPA